MVSARFSTPKGPFSLAYLAECSGASLYHSDGATCTVSDLAPLSHAQADNLSMLHEKKYIKALKTSQAGACIISPHFVHHAPKHMHLLIHNNPYKAYALIAQVFYPSDSFQGFIAPTAFIAPSAQLGKECYIAHGAYIGEQVRIGARCKIGVNTFIGDGVVIGDDCCIENNVSISHTVMGNKVLIYPGARIGQDGFGFAGDGQAYYKIPQAGGVVIGSNVEIGANTCIDRGSMSNTEIGDWCRLDNLVQIGHNVKVGKGAILCGQVGIAGSSKIGEFASLGGKAGVSGHLTIGARATILVGSIAVQDVEPGARVGGFPALPDRDWHRQTCFLKKRTKPGKA
ncbi:UDP-3-O-(3-hydroxymyristoyl)glucosamine N-acyltransferase [Legionella parisiensis]|uniref:UDP-3-O-acylglucosamine N-acyltransferase n=1 Tax=Legionella parisiensis TaxID=45071 RepID=A0A1E5JSE9_9GAMM|nr:UDP-3-O-(3-hydroxymyristoyl)glucosamine N-acyltransferase [Legionella parisiensis]KTD43184.1 UDP-3-O-[3-hydroxymyristoyl] glucosamine N-acyltransferase [Legionella parisiensis]OEH47459.1 UDP-3-O-acylglucosamine N-acyltransferase [Legionella parisiensis]STX77735.1 UDP-3-O-[3-hydroxymyristoyl] glucosamine N-acyltransferase [Legionella parisiensis]